MIRNVRLLYVHNFLNDFRFHSAFLVIYFAQITGSYSLAMIVVAIEAFTSALMDIPTGVFSDFMGRKCTIAVGSIVTTASVSFYAFANNITWLIIGSFLSGLAQCLFNGNNNALLYESLKAEGKEGQFHHYQGRTRSMFQLALGLSAFGSSLFTSRGLSFLFMLGIIPQALSIVVSLFFKEPRLHIPTQHTSLSHLKTACSKIYRNPRLGMLIVGQAISYGADEANFALKTPFVNMLWPTWAVGVWRGINHAIGFVSMWFAGHVLNRTSSSAMLVIAESIWFVSQSIAVLINNVISPVILFSGPLLYGPFLVARDNLLQKEFTDEQRATMGSVATFTGSVFYGVIAFVIGGIADRFGLAAGVGFGVVTHVVALPIFIWLFRKSF